MSICIFAYCVCTFEYILLCCVNFQEMADKIKKKLVSAKKDNDFIYLDQVPSVDSLDSIGRAVLAKATPVQSTMSSSFTDLFPSLVPVAINQAIATYENKKAELVNKEVGRLREATQLLNGYVIWLILCMVKTSLNRPRTYFVQMSSIAYTSFFSSAVFKRLYQYQSHSTALFFHQTIIR